jgi:hypothetical protein
MGCWAMGLAARDMVSVAIEARHLSRGAMATTEELVWGREKRQARRFRDQRGAKPNRINSATIDSHDLSDLAEAKVGTLPSEIKLYSPEKSIRGIVSMYLPHHTLLGQVASSG